MVTGLLLLPVLAILVWLYWYLLPGRKWLPRDSIVLLLLLACMTVFVATVGKLDFEDAGPLWPYIVSAAGAYGILLVGLSMALALRWRRAKAKERLDRQ